MPKYRSFETNGETTECEGDTNGDGRVNSTDALEILKHSAGLNELTNMVYQWMLFLIDL